MRSPHDQAMNTCEVTPPTPEQAVRVAVRGVF
jgi:hypothetical protein